MKRKQTIIIPSYCPSDKIIYFIKELNKHFYRIVVVDDGSGNEYSSIFEILKNMAGVTVLKHYTNQGKGRALKTAFNYCLIEGNINFFLGGVITVDGDGQHAIKDIINVSNVMNQNSDKLVLGCRLFRGRVPLRSRFGNSISKVIYSWLCGLNVSDTQTGLRGIPYNSLEEFLAIEGEGYEYETNMLLDAKDNDLQIIEVPIQTIYDSNNGCSHFKPLRDSWRIYSIIIKYSFSSIISVIVDYTIFFLLTSQSIGVAFSTYLARFGSCMFNFILNKNIVFRLKGHFVATLFKYLGLILFSGTISAIFVGGLYKCLGFPIIIAKVLVEIALYFMNYYIQRTFVFHK